MSQISAFQLGHFFSEMDRSACGCDMTISSMFQLGHFFSEMDSITILGVYGSLSTGFQLGHFFSEMDSFPCLCRERWRQIVSIGPLLLRNG